MSTARDHLRSVGPADPRGKPPQHDHHAEEALLSFILNVPNGFERVADIVLPEHFFPVHHQRIARAAVALGAQGVEVSLFSVSTWLRDHGELEGIGGSGSIRGVEYLKMLSYEIPHDERIERIALRLRDLWRVRQMVATCQMTAAAGYGPIEDVQAYLEGAERAVAEIAAPPCMTTATVIGTTLRTVFTDLETAAARGGGITGLPTGFAGLDRLTAGLHPDEMTVLAARPGMGKTACAMKIAIRVAATPPRAGEPMPGVAFFSLEMTKEQLVTRAICTEARVDSNKARTGMLLPKDWTELTATGKWLGSIPLWIDDQRPSTPIEIRAKARRIAKECEKNGARLSLVVVDYLQLVHAAMLIQRGANREQEVSFVAQCLRNLATDLHVPVLALAQLNRVVDRAKEKRPTLSDLRESGGIEANADTVIFIHREDYYLKEKTPEQDRGIAELIVEKQRHGPTGTAKTRFYPTCVLFDDGDQPIGDWT